MGLANLAVFSRQVYTVMTETLAQQVYKFNEATRGGLILRSAANQGDYADTAFWAHLAGLVRRRDAYGDGNVAAIDLKHLVETSVKVASGTPPVNMPPHMLSWIQRSPGEAAAVVGVQLAKQQMADMLNTSIMALSSAMGQVPAIVNDTTATAGGASIKKLNATARKFGDRAEELQCWLMHSQSLFDIYGDAINNSNRLFVFGNIRVAEDGFGRALVMTDSPSLVDASVPATPKYSVIGLRPGACLVEQNGDFEDNFDTRNGGENIRRTYQAQWTYNLSVDGFAWDKTAGGHSPTNAAIGAAANWDRIATFDKDLPGVMLKTQVSAD